MARAVGGSLPPVVSAPSCAVTDASTEHYMGWTDTMRHNAEVALCDHGPAGDDAADGTASASASASASWDPYDVWLTRVKQPRELAAQELTGDGWQTNWRQT